MQILIDIPEDFYEALKKTDEMSSGLRSEKTLMSVVYSAVAKGTPFPEEPVLDKIRAEMADLASRTMNDNRASGMWTCIDILDKYKRERKERDDMEYGKWIPTSERLPKMNEFVGNVCKYYLIQDEYGDMHVAHFSKNGWTSIDGIREIKAEIVAWMLLPLPWKAESEE